MLCGDRGKGEQAVVTAVIGEGHLDSHPCPGKRQDGAPKEAGRGGTTVVVQHLGVGKAAVVVDGYDDGKHETAPWRQSFSVVNSS